MEPKIEPATIDNLKDIQGLNLMLFKREYDEFDKTFNCEWTMSNEGEEYFKNRITKEDGCAYIAVAGDEIIGYLVGGMYEEVHYRKPAIFAELENMFVLETYRGKGVGTQLYRAFVEWCKSKRVWRIHVVASAQNTDGINFYRKNGFVDYDLALEADI